MKRDLFEAGLNEAAAGQGCVHLVGRKGAAPRRIMAQLLRYGESNFWFVSSCNGLRVFAAVWPYSLGSQSRCRTVRFTVRFEFIRPVARLRHLIGQLKLTLSQARNRQTVMRRLACPLRGAHLDRSNTMPVASLQRRSSEPLRRRSRLRSIRRP